MVAEVIGVKGYEHKSIFKRALKHLVYNVGDASSKSERGVVVDRRRKTETGH